MSHVSFHTAKANFPSSRIAFVHIRAPRTHRELLRGAAGSCRLLLGRLQGLLQREDGQSVEVGAQLALRALQHARSFIRHPGYHLPHAQRTPLR